MPGAILNSWFLMRLWTSGEEDIKCVSMRKDDTSSTACELTMLILSISVTLNVTCLTVASLITKSCQQRWPIHSCSFYKVVHVLHGQETVSIFVLLNALYHRPTIVVCVSLATAWHVQDRTDLVWITNCSALVVTGWSDAEYQRRHSATCRCCPWPRGASRQPAHDEASRQPCGQQLLPPPPPASINQPPRHSRSHESACCSCDSS